MQYEMKHREFPQPAGSQEGEVPQEVKDFANTLPQQGPEAPAYILPPFWIASATSGNPMWMVAWAIIRSHGV